MIYRIRRKQQKRKRKKNTWGKFRSYIFSCSIDNLKKTLLALLWQSYLSQLWPNISFSALHMEDGRSWQIGCASGRYSLSFSPPPPHAPHVHTHKGNHGAEWTNCQICNELFRTIIFIRNTLIRNRRLTFWSVRSVIFQNIKVRWNVISADESTQPEKCFKHIILW